MKERFAQLLDGFSALVAQSDTTGAGVLAAFRNLLSEFGERRVRAEMIEQTNAADDRHQFLALLDGYNETVEHYRQQQEQVADDFNLLDVTNLTGKEIRHSMVLAWLLDHDLRRFGTHAQGNLGFRLFLNDLGMPMEYSDCKYWVRREVAGDESIVDLEVASRERFLIHIENKIWSCEGTDQTDRSG
jgi:hypothetical protein